MSDTKTKDVIDGCDQIKVISRGLVVTYTILGSVIQEAFGIDRLRFTPITFTRYLPDRDGEYRARDVDLVGYVRRIQTFGRSTREWKDRYETVLKEIKAQIGNIARYEKWHASSPESERHLHITFKQNGLADL